MNPLTLSFCFISLFFLFSYLFVCFQVCPLYFTLSFLHVFLLCLSLHSFFVYFSSLLHLFFLPLHYSLFSFFFFFPCLNIPLFFLPFSYSFFLSVCYFCPICLLPTFILSFLSSKLPVSFVLCNVILMLSTLLIASNSHSSLHTYLS